MLVPPAVLSELTHPAAPKVVSEWSKNPPPWLKVQSPAILPTEFDNLDFGERQALALAKEVGAEWVLLDDKVARRCAEQQALKVKGTLGVLAQAANAGLLNFREAVGLLQQTTMHIDATLAQEVIDEYEKRADKSK